MTRLLLEINPHGRGRCARSMQCYQLAVSVPRGLDPEIVRELVGAGYRALAFKYHPDHGGQTEIMQRINTTVEGLRRLLASSGTRR